jgi:hypothetical protein
VRFHEDFYAQARAIIPYAGLPGLLVVRYFVIVEIAYCDADSGMFNFMST